MGIFEVTKPTVFIAIAVLATLQIGCSTNQNKPNATSGVMRQTATIKQVTDTQPISTNKKVKTWFDHTKPFEILNAERGITKQSSASDTNMCEGWTISIRDIPKIIKECKPIEGEEWHHMFEVLPCIVRGQLKQGGQPFEFEINGGSWMFISGIDTTIRLGNYKKQNEKYFITNAWDGKE